MPSRSSLICGSGLTMGYSISISQSYEVFCFGNLPKEFGEVKQPILLPIQNIKSIAGNIPDLKCLDFDGNVFIVGKKNIFSGFQAPEINLSPTKVEGLPFIKEIYTATGFTICLAETGDVYYFGKIYKKFTFPFTNEDAPLPPKRFSSLKDIDLVSCGTDFTIFKNVNGDIFVFGDNSRGQLGTTNTKCHEEPFLCSHWPNNIIDIRCGNSHTLALTSNQEVYSCGHNGYGQLARITEENSGFRWYKQDEQFSCNLKKIEELPEITRIECGCYHVICIDINNNLYVFGSNGDGQLGLGDTDDRNKPIKHPLLSNIIDISKGGFYSFVKTSNNEIYAFGDNRYSQLGIKTVHEEQITPIRVFEDNEDIWFSNINKSKQKSARF